MVSSAWASTGRRVSSFFRSPSGSGNDPTSSIQHQLPECNLPAPARNCPPLRHRSFRMASGYSATMSKAAVLVGIDQPLEIRTDVEVQAPHAGEIKVRMGASGVCHSDLSMQNGTLMAPTPMVLGHE